MNVENIQKVIDVIKDDANKFDMADYGNPACGTAACICGWSNYLAKDDLPDTMVFYDDHFRAGDFLGLKDWEVQDNLFYATDSNGAASIYDVTREEAIITLEKLIDTGKVDWSHAATYTAGY